MKFTRRFTVGIVLSALVAGPLAANEVYVDPTEVLWSSKSVSAVTLSVTGPGGFEHRETFEAGAVPFLSVFDKNGQLLDDGQYSWELIALPSLDAATREAMAAARADGRPVSREVLATLPQGQKTSGVVRVRDGAFLSQVGEEVVGEATEGSFDKAQVYATDLIVQGSSCIGIDCGTNESFGFDTLRLKENNLRIKFEDISNSATFPGNDWELLANESNNGGANKFSIIDVTGDLTPFTILAGAPNNSLYVNATGDLGVSTGSPAVELHVADGDSPTLRLEQDGSAGFATRTWDIAGNETNFFVRDVENGSALPLRIRAGAPQNAFYISPTGDVHLGGENPNAKLDVKGSGEFNGALTVNTTNEGIPFVVAETGAAAARVMASFENNGGVRMDLKNTQNSRTWRVDHSSNGSLQLDFGADTVPEVTVYGVDIDATNQAGDMVVAGDVTANGVLLTSDVNKKTAFAAVDSQSVLQAVTAMPVTTWVYKDRQDTRHMGPMAQDFHAAFGLGSSEKHISQIDTAGVTFAAIQALNQQLEDKDARLEALKERLAALESLLGE